MTRTRRMKNMRITKKGGIITMMMYVDYDDEED